MAPRYSRVVAPTRAKVTKDLERIKEELLGEERTIEKMLNKSIATRKAIRKQMDRMEKLASQIPDDEWSGKLASLWRLYNEDNDVTASSGSGFSTDTKQVKVNNDSIKSQIEFVFGKFAPIKDVIDIVEQKQLLELISKVQLVISKASKDNCESLESDTFSLAISKLPEEKQEQFSHLCDRGQRSKSLIDLRMYLQDEIILYAKLLNSGQLFGEEYEVQITPEGINSRSVLAKRKRSISMSGESSSLSNNSVAEQAEQNVCRYCKNKGHFIAHCPERNAVLCLRCYQYGHTKNHCRRPMKRIGLEDIMV